MRVRELTSMLRGHIRANGGGGEDAPSDESFLRALADEKKRELLN